MTPQTDSIRAGVTPWASFTDMGFVIRKPLFKNGEESRSKILREESSQLVETRYRIFVAESATFMTDTPFGKFSVL